LPGGSAASDSRLIQDGAVEQTIPQVLPEAIPEEPELENN
jgi:hypothetical protein